MVFVVQTVLISARKLKWHKSVGLAAFGQPVKNGTSYELSRRAEISN